MNKKDSKMYELKILKEKKEKNKNERNTKF